MKNIETQHDAADATEILNKIAQRVESCSSKELSEAGKTCIQLINQLIKEKESGGSSRAGLSGNSILYENASSLKRRLKVALRDIALRATKSSVWQQRRDALVFLEYSIRNDVDLKQNESHASCEWLDEHNVIEDLFGERAHQHIVSETVSLLLLLDLTEKRLMIILDAAMMHVGSVRAEVHKVILSLLKDMNTTRTRFVLDRIMDVFEDSAPLIVSGSSSSTVPSSSSPALMTSLKRTGSDTLQAAFEFVTAMFDSTKLHGLLTTADVMMKGKRIAFRAMDVLVAALLSHFCEDQDIFQKLVQDSLFHCLQSSWGEVDGRGQGKACKDYVAQVCCDIVKNSDNRPRAVEGAFAVLIEVVRLFPRTNFAQKDEKTREECIFGLQKQFDVLQACLSNLKMLSASIDLVTMDSDQVLETELWTRLLQLRYLLENCSGTEYNLTLDERQVETLWKALGGPTEACLRWLRLAADSGGIFDDSVTVYLFSEYICQIEPSSLRSHGFNCFQAFFGDINIAKGALKAAGRDGQKSGCKINGAAFVGRRVRVLWKDEKMHNGTICSYLPPCNRSSSASEVQKHTVRWDDTGKEDTHDWTDLHDWHLLEDEFSVNILPFEIKGIKNSQLSGLDFLWRICFQNPDNSVVRKAQDMLLDLGRFMPASFKDELLSKVFGSAQNKGMLLSEQPAASACSASSRSLDLIATFLNGQLRVCDDVFSFRQYLRSRSHGFIGRGKPMTVVVSVSQAPHTVKVCNTHSHGSIYDVMGKVIPQWDDSNPIKISVVHNGSRLVYGPNTTFEELEVANNGELQLNPEEGSPVEPAFGSIGDTIAQQPMYYNILFDILERGDSDLQLLTWKVLMALPTSIEALQAVHAHQGPWTQLPILQQSLWRSLYNLQILDSLLMPSKTDSGAEQSAAAFRRSFVSNGGIGVVLETMSRAAAAFREGVARGRKAQSALIRDHGFPIILRVLRLCVAEEKITLGDLIDDVWDAFGQIMTFIIILEDTEEETLMDAILDGLVVISELLCAASDGSQTASGQFSNFFSPKSQNELKHLGIERELILEESNMSSDAGVLVHKFLLRCQDQKVRQTTANVLSEIACKSSELLNRVIELMGECLTVDNRDCTSCKEFFELLSGLLERSPDNVVVKVSMLSTGLLLSADQLPLCNEMMFQLLTLVHNILQDAAVPKGSLVQISDQLVEKIYQDYLMRVSTHRGNPDDRFSAKMKRSGESRKFEVAPLCDTPEIRQVAWSLLLTSITKYSKGYTPQVLESIGEFTARTRLPVKISFSRHNSSPKEDWEHKATVERRKLPFVGLKNQGATCYMNAMLQQLFLEFALRKCIVSAPLADCPPENGDETWKCQICTLDNDWSSRVCLACEQGERPVKVDPVPHGELLKQLQRTFRFMEESELQSFDPLQLVEACRDLGLHFKVTSQNDAAEFLDKLLEGLEKEVGGKEHGDILKSCFRFRVCTQLASVECHHRKPVNTGEFEKSFKVSVERMGTLEKAIEDALAGELMTGDSRVDCEMCTIASKQSDHAVKRAMQKTMFFDRRSMPTTLCVQLNRFQFQGNAFIKINDRLAFPMELDLARFTKPPKMAPNIEPEIGSDLENTRTGSETSDDPDFGMDDVTFESMYELRGIVVHSGQFSFGHYYSFAKDLASDKWLKLDDDQVSEFDLANLESECFGGIQTTVNKWTNCVFKTEKTASAYMLFYHRRESSESNASDPAGRSTDSVSDCASNLESATKGITQLSIAESSSQSAHSEEDGASARVDEILDTNEQMLRRSLFFDHGFSSFVLDLIHSMENSNEQISIEVFKMCISVMYKSVMHSETRPRMLSADGKDGWFNTMKRLLLFPEASVTLLKMATAPGDAPDYLPCWLEGCIIECPYDTVRQTFVSLIAFAIDVVAHNPERCSVNSLDLVGKVVDATNLLVPSGLQNSKHIPQFGEIYWAVALQGGQYTTLLQQKETMGLLLQLYVCPKAVDKELKLGGTDSWQFVGMPIFSFETILRTCSLMLQLDDSSHEPHMTGQMLGSAFLHAARKLCDQNPMGGAFVEGRVALEPLLLEICAMSDSQTMFEIIENVVSKLSKSFHDNSTRKLQSCCAQFLCRFLKRASEIDQRDQKCAWVADSAEIVDTCEKIVNHVVHQLRRRCAEENYDDENLEGGFSTRMRLAQLLVLFRSHPCVVDIMEPHAEALRHVAVGMNVLTRRRAGRGGENIGNLSFDESMDMIENSILMARQEALPTEIFLSGATGVVSVVNGVYKLESQQRQEMANPLWTQSPIYTKKDSGSASTSISISKRIFEEQNRPVEHWEVYTVATQGQPVILLQTATVPASHQVVPPTLSEMYTLDKRHNLLVPLQILGQVKYLPVSFCFHLCKSCILPSTLISLSLCTI